MVYAFQQSLSDFITLVAAILITLTGFRVVYLIAILSVNGHMVRFNGFLSKMNESNARMWLKLQQIEKVMQDPEKRALAKDRYLTVKQCVWLAFVELILDMMVLPFIVAYVFVPWRFSELVEIAVS